MDKTEKKAVKNAKRREKIAKKNLKKAVLKERGLIIHSLPFKLETSIFVLLVFFFTLLVGILSFSIGNYNKRSFSELSKTIVERGSAALSYWLSSYYKDLRIFTKNEVFWDGDVHKIRNFIMENQHLMSVDFEYVGICGIDGILYTSDGQATNITDTSYYGAIMQSGEPNYISDPIRSPTLGKYLFTIAEPAIDNNGIMFGIFVGAVPVDIIQHEIENTNLGEMGFAYAIDSNGTTIAYPDESQIMKNKYKLGDEEAGLIGYTEMTEDMLSGSSDYRRIFNKSNNQYDYVYYAPIDGTHWSVGLVIPEKEVLLSARKSSLNIAACSLVIVTLLILFTSIYMTKQLNPLLYLKHSISEIASGDADLTKKISIKSKDEIGGVVSGFNTFIDNLHTIISQIKESKSALTTVDKSMQKTTEETGKSIAQISSDINMVTSHIENQSQSVEQTVSSVKQIAKNIENLNKLIENQASGINQASAAIEQMLENINSVSKSTEMMVTAFSQLEEFTRSGIEKQNAVNTQINLIEEQSLMLLNANKTISKIASETNLLAMNASIEAAHAGAAGMGFSVVADEIRALSESSTAQSKTIGSELQKIQKSIENVVSASSEAKNAFGFVSEKIQQTDSIVQQIRSAMEESEQGSRQITQALSMMHESTSQVRTSSSNMSADNQSILNEVNNLQEATDAMKSNIGRMSFGAQQIESNGKTLTTISETMQKSIEQIGSQIDLFKV